MDLPQPFGNDNNYGIIAGGGVDVAIVRHVSLRLFQADYEYAQHEYGPLLQPTLSGVRLSTGLVWQFGSVGGQSTVSASAACSIQPVEVFAGEPVTATASGSNFNPRRTVKYEWSGTGVRVPGGGATTQIDTTGLAPGSYQITANLSDGSRGGVAYCSARVVIKEPLPPIQHPPTISCSPNPGTVKPGEPSTITAIGHSPDNRPLTYGFSTSGGHVASSGAQTTLDTAGAPAGLIAITCTTTDDRGLSASARTNVSVEAPPAPLQASKCGSIEFTRDKQRPARVDNEAKATLDLCALRLQQESDASAVIVGNSDPSEKNALNMAEQRAVNTKDYLVREKGIDPGRLRVRTGSGGTQTVDIWVVPVGVTFNVEGTRTFEEREGKAQPRTTPRHKASR
jgi:outer membrane protein OmpA-like peptidoglycan-associated protein